MGYQGIPQSSPRGQNRIVPLLQEGIILPSAAVVERGGPKTFDDDINLVRSFVIGAYFACHLHEIALCLTEQYSLPDASRWRILK